MTQSKEDDKRAVGKNSVALHFLCRVNLTRSDQTGWKKIDLRFTFSFSGAEGISSLVAVKHKNTIWEMQDTIWEMQSAIREMQGTSQEMQNTVWEMQDTKSEMLDTIQENIDTLWEI